jgi:hypothetical protein
MLYGADEVVATDLVELVEVADFAVLVEEATPPASVAMVETAPHSSRVSPTLQQMSPLAQ